MRASVRTHRVLVTEEAGVSRDAVGSLVPDIQVVSPIHKVGLIGARKCENHYTALVQELGVGVGRGTLPVQTPSSKCPWIVRSVAAHCRLQEGAVIYGSAPTRPVPEVAAFEM